MPFIKIGGHRGGSRTVEPLYAEVDEDDYEKVNNYKWGINIQSSNHTQYAHTRTGGCKLHLHRFIMGLKDYKDDKRIVNHKDGNGLNNKKENLEICDHSYNSQSFRCINKNKGFVYYDTSMKRLKRWKAQITINKITYQQRFETEEDAKQWLINRVPL